MGGSRTTPLSLIKDGNTGNFSSTTDPLSNLYDELQTILGKIRAMEQGNPVTLFHEEFLHGILDTTLWRITLGAAGTVQYDTAGVAGHPAARVQANNPGDLAILGSYQTFPIQPASMGQSSSRNLSMYKNMILVMYGPAGSIGNDGVIQFGLNNNNNGAPGANCIYVNSTDTGTTARMTAAGVPATNVDMDGPIDVVAIVLSNKQVDFYCNGELQATFTAGYPTENLYLWCRCYGTPAIGTATWWMAGALLAYIMQPISI